MIGEDRDHVGIVVCSGSEPALKVVRVNVGVVVVVEVERNGVFEDFGEAQRNGSLPAARDGANADYHYRIHTTASPHCLFSKQFRYGRLPPH